MRHCRKASGSLITVAMCFFISSCGNGRYTQIHIAATTDLLRTYAETVRVVTADCGIDKAMTARYPDVFYFDPGWSNWKGPYLQGKPKLNDHFGTTIKFIGVVDGIMIRSAGPDKRFETRDDIVQIVKLK